MSSEDIGYAVKRIEYMEKVFDEVQKSFQNCPDFAENEELQRKVSLLTQYLESGQWMRDFQLDEKGDLPKELKRGILSEDGLYNLLSEIDEAKRRKANPINRFFDKIKSIF